MFVKIEKYIKLRKNKLLSKIVHVLLLNKGLDIPWCTIIGKNVKFPHNSFGLVLHPNAVIEDNVILYQGVTIGRADVYNDFSNSSMGKIIVGEGAIICAGAKVLCKENDLIIGKNTIVAANSVLLQSTGDNEIWAGVPAKKVGIRKE